MLDLEFINKITQETLDALDALTWQEEEILEQSELLIYSCFPNCGEGRINL